MPDLLNPISNSIKNRQEKHNVDKIKSNEKLGKSLTAKEFENTGHWKEKGNLPQKEKVLNTAADKTEINLKKLHKLALKPDNPVEENRLKLKKLQKLALKLNNPVEENRLMKKINSFLRKSPNKFYDINIKGTESRQQLEHRILQKLKNALLNYDIRTSNREKPKYYSRYVIENLKIIIRDWLKILEVNTKHGFGPINDDDIFNYVFDKVEPIVLNRAKSDSEFENALKLKVTDMVNNLDLLSKNHTTNLVDTLVNEIINIDERIPIMYVQPTDAEIKRFVKDEIIFITEKSCMAINTSKILDLEMNLTDFLFDLIDIEDLNDNAISKLSKLLENIGELTAEQSKYFANIVITDYKEFFFRFHFFSGHDKKKYEPPDVSLGLCSKIDSRLLNERSLERYTYQLINVIEKWFISLNIQINDKSFHKLVIRNFASDIVDHYKYLENNPTIKGSYLDELEHLKYQIFKSSCKINCAITLEHVEELMKSINLLPVPLTFNAINSILESCSNEFIDPYIEHLNDIIYGWFKKLPLDVHSLKDTNFNRKLIKYLAVDIKENIGCNNLNTIDEKIDKWVLKTFNKKLSSSYIQQLKHRIYSFVKKSLKKISMKPVQENIIKNYQRIIHTWMNELSLKLTKEDVFILNKNKLIQKLAIKLYDTVIRLKESPSLDIYALLREDILEWLKILQIAGQSDEYIDKSVEILVNKIKLYHLELRNTTVSRQMADKLLFGKLETVMLDYITNLPKNTNENRINQVNMHHRNQDDTLEVNVEKWLSKLPFYITDLVYFKIKKKRFIDNLKLLRTLGATDEVIIKEIIKFMKSLPMVINKKQDDIQLENKKNTITEDRMREKPHSRDDTSKIIANIIKNWVKHLSLKPTYNPKELISLIDKISPLIVNLRNGPRQKLNEKYDHQIRVEIMKFLERFALKGCSEYYVSQMANCVSKNLKDVIKKSMKTDVTNGNSDIKPIGNITVNDYLNGYTANIINEIKNWLNRFDFSQNNNKAFKVLINDLTHDIIERERYLKINPEHRRTLEVETEQIKCLIFKRLNKLKDYQKIATTKHMEDLMRQVQSIAVGIFTQEPHVYMQANIKENNKTNTSISEHHLVERNIAGTSNQSSNKPLSLLISENKGSLGESDLATCISVQATNEDTHIKNSNPKAAILEKYETIFKKKVYDLPIDTSTPEAAQLSELARTAIYNSIMKIFFSLKSDQELENDYGYFELILEDKLDQMLDLLPQTEEMKEVRHGWKVSIINNALNMLKEMHEVSDRPSFRQQLKDGFNRKFAKSLEFEQCFLLQQGFLVEMAEAFILETKYKEDDPLKANIYRQRLVKKVDELVNHLTRQHNIEFRFLNHPQLIQYAMKILTEVPLPNEGILNEEVEEIILAEEIEQWYKELPVTPYINDFDQVFRKRMMNILAQKLHEIEKIDGEIDDSKERQMKHEISKFLTERGRLEHDQDLNINFMVDELNNRLKRRGLKDTTYDVFDKNKPFSSTLAKLDNTEILAPLIDASTTTEFFNPTQRYLPPDQYLPVRHRVSTDKPRMPNQNYILTGPQYQSGGPSHQQYSDLQSSPYSNGIPYQWPAQQGQMMSNAAPGTQAIGISKCSVNCDSACQNLKYLQPEVQMQNNIRLPFLPTSNFTQNNLGPDQIGQESSPKQNVFQERDSYVTGLCPNRNLPCRSQKTYARGMKSLSPSFRPDLNREYVNNQRPDSPEMRCSQSSSPNKTHKPTEDKESICLKLRKATKSSPSSVHGNTEGNQSGSCCSPKLGKASKSPVSNSSAKDYEPLQKKSHEKDHDSYCSPESVRDPADNISEDLTRQGFGQGSIQRRRTKSLEQERNVNAKPKIIIKCKCADKYNKQRRICLDSQPCPCTLLITPCEFK